MSGNMNTATNIGAGPGGELLTITVKEICERYQISRKTVERMIQDGRLPAPYRFGKSVRLPRQATVDAIESTREVS